MCPDSQKTANKPLLRFRKTTQLVFMDLHMPVMDGFEATRTLRQWPQYKTLPIVALTADVFAQTREKATEGHDDVHR